MDTLQDIMANLDNGTKVAVGTDAITPEGHFQVTAKVQGRVRIYLLEGEPSNPEAIIKGNVEMTNNCQSGIAYRGNHLRGGNMLGPFTGSNKKHFALMAG